MCRFSRQSLSLLVFFSCECDSDSTEEMGLFLFCNFLFFAACNFRLSCLPFVWHSLFIWTHTHTHTHTHTTHVHWYACMQMSTLKSYHQKKKKVARHAWSLHFQLPDRTYWTSIDESICKFSWFGHGRARQHAACAKRDGSHTMPCRHHISKQKTENLNPRRSLQLSTTRVWR